MRFELFSLYFSIIFDFLGITADLFRKTFAIFLRKFRRKSRSKETNQPARNVPGTSPEGPLKVPTSGTARGPSGDLQGTLRGPTKKLIM